MYVLCAYQLRLKEIHPLMHLYNFRIGIKIVPNCVGNLTSY